MKFSNRAHAVKPSATLAIAALASSMKASGIDVLAMSAGEPDFDTPANIKNAAKASLDRGETKYTPVPGTMALRKAVALDTKNQYGIDVTTDQVIVGAGGKQVLFNAACALLDHGDEALIPAPYWVSYPDMVMFNGATPVFVEPSSRPLPLAEDFAQKITERTRLVFLNSPSNPTGCVYSRDELSDIAALFRRHENITIISDDIYGQLVYDSEFVSIIHVAPDLMSRTLIGTGVSKTYAMTGWRIGFGIAPKELISAMSRLQGASTSGASCVAQAAALEAIVGDQTTVHEMVRVFKQRRDRMCAQLATIPDVTVPHPGGAFYAFPDVSAYFSARIPGSQALCKHLLEVEHLAVVPGVEFGADKNLRMSFACSDADIDEGIKRLKRGLESLRQ